MLDSAQTNWNAARKIYGDEDLLMLMVGREHTSYSIGHRVWIRVT